mmetsp:Transcript_3451/g.9964  ORF Transcript_3451/g.9964 Transcript_3451/m.9964 type:complete len:266 (-) Transcript_3451:215-1012(-)
MSPARARSGQTTTMLGVRRLAHAWWAAMLVDLGCSVAEAARAQTAKAAEGSAAQAVATPALNGDDGSVDVGPILARLQALEDEVKEAREQHRSVGQQILSTHEEQQRTLSEFAMRIANTIDSNASKPKPKKGNRLEVKAARLARDPNATLIALWKASKALQDAGKTVGTTLLELARGETVSVFHDDGYSGLKPFAEKLIMDTVKSTNDLPEMAEAIKAALDTKFEGKWQCIVGFSPLFSYGGWARSKSMFEALLGHLEIVIFRSA